MILPTGDGRLLVAHRGALVSIAEDGSPSRTFRIGGSSLIRVVEGEDGWFAVKHHEFTDPPVRLITAHHSSDPAIPRASLEIGDDWAVTGSGDAHAWRSLPALYSLVYPYLLQLSDGSARVLRLPGIPGHDEDPIDPYRLIPCAGGKSAVVTFSRGGRMIVYDLHDGAIRVDTTFGYGPPILRFDRHGSTAWLAHDDTIFVLDAAAFESRTAFRIRDTLRGREISDLHFDASGKRCAVAFSEARPIPLLQPYRLAPVEGAIVMFDTETRTPIASTPTTRWVAEVAVLGDDRVAFRERAGELRVEIESMTPGGIDLYPPRGPGEPWH